MSFEEALIKEDLFQSSIVSYIDEIERVEKIIVWGSGGAAKNYIKFLNKFNLENKIIFIADNNSRLWGTTYKKYIIKNIDNVLEYVTQYPDTRVVVASQSLAAIKRQLISKGIRDNKVDTLGYGLVKDYWTFSEFTPYQIIKRDWNSYKSTYESLADEFSKKVYIGILNSKISLNNKYLNNISSKSEEQYFAPDIIELEENEVFCDCGSFHGDTLDVFIKHTKGVYEKYLAFEADPTNFYALLNNINEKGYKNVDAYKLGCWDKKDSLKFSPNLTAGKLMGDGEITINVDALDNIVQTPLTFLKMDIEGAEEKALIGAKDIIKKHQPILAICLYHSLEDYGKLPTLIREFDSNYTFYIRHYTELVDAETVCYAIPKHRLITK